MDPYKIYFLKGLDHPLLEISQYQMVFYSVYGNMEFPQNVM